MSNMILSINIIIISSLYQWSLFNTSLYMMFDNGHRHNKDKNSQNSNIQLKNLRYFTGQIMEDYQELKINVCSMYLK